MARADRARARLLIASGCVAAALASSAAAQQGVASPSERFVSPESMRAALTELPVPDLGREEEAVREQLLRYRARLDSLLADPSTSQAALAEAFGQLGQLYLLYDQNDVGPVALRNATLLAPEDPRWHYYLAVHQGYEGEVEETERELRRVLELVGDDPPTEIRLADLLLDRGEIDEAEKLYEKVLAQYGETAAAIAGLGRIALERDDPERAVELLTRALELQPEADSLYHPLGMSYRALGDRERAREAMAKNKHGRLIFDDPLMIKLAESNLSTEARFQAGSDAMRRGDMEKAAEYFRLYLELRPEDETAWHNLGVALLATDHFDEGVAMLRRSIETEPDYRGGHYSLASALAEDGRFEEALEHYRRAHELDPVEPVIHADYATLLAKLGRRDEAMAELELLLEEHPDDPYARLKYGTVLAIVGRTEEARRELESMADSGALDAPGRAEALYHLGVIAENEGDLERARALFERSLELDPSSLEANRIVGQLLARDGDYEEAVENFERALESAPWDVSLHFSRAMALILGEDYPGARIALQDSVAEHPENLDLANLLARFLATCPDDGVRDGAEAVRIGNRILEVRLTVEYAETMAMALAEVGRYDDAAELQARVLEQIARQSGEGSAAYRAADARLTGYRAARPVRSPWRGE